MTKNGRPSGVSPPSSTLAMLGWSIRARACRSASNRASTCLRVHPRLDQLDRDLPLDRLGLLGHPDRAHAALADRARAACTGRRAPPRPRPPGRPRSRWRRRRSAVGGRPSRRPPAGRLLQEVGVARLGPRAGPRPPPAGRGRRRRPRPGRRPARPGRASFRAAAKIWLSVTGRLLPGINAPSGGETPDGFSDPLSISALQPGPGVRPVGLGRGPRDARAARPPPAGSGRRSTGA